MGTASNDAGPERGNDAPLPDHPDEAVRPAPAKDASKSLVETRQTSQIAKAQEAGAQALTAQVEASIKAKYFLARNFPRNWLDVRSQLLQNFKRPILAEGALYSKPIGGKPVEGLSIRFAEEAFRTMGNIDISTLLISDDDDKRVYQVIGMDLETNANIPVIVVVTKQVERSSKKADSIVIATRTNSSGKLVYILKATSEDDYRAKEAAQLQKARRDVILFLVPGDIKEECEQQIRATMKNRDAEDPQGAITRMIDAFFTFGVTVAEIEKYLGHGIRTINAAERQRCRQILVALRDGETTWAEVMEAKIAVNTGVDESVKVGDAAPVSASKGAAAKIADAVKGKTNQKTGIPERIQKLIDNEHVAQALTDEDKEELRQFRTDNPALFAAK